MARRGMFGSWGFGFRVKNAGQAQFVGKAQRKSVNASNRRGASKAKAAARKSKGRARRR